jgi:predicted nucleic acid-binding protein
MVPGGNLLGWDIAVWPMLLKTIPVNNFNILVDTGFWIALFDPHDDPKNCIEAERIAKMIEQENLVIPFPTLYEFVNSKFSRKESVTEFENLLNRPTINLLSDVEYKENAISNFFEKHRYTYSDLSLVDEILKLILHDKNIQIDYIVTFDSALKNEALSLGIKAI